MDRISRLRLALQFAAAVSTWALIGGCGRSETVEVPSQDPMPTSTAGESGPTSSSTGPTTGPTTGPEPDLPTAEECAVDAQCDDEDPCVTARCIDGVCIFRPRDEDNDGFAPFECGGDDCNDFNPNTFPGADENCFDGDDNDCNGVADCFDPVCADVPNCGCVPEPGGEICDNGQDEDCDTTVDCNDTDCIGTPACGCADTEAGSCGNGFDEDCDGAFDCDDSDCAGDPVCACVGVDEVCGNGTDDDCDDLIDCADPDCEGTFGCVCTGPPTPEACADGIDNDCDELVDCADPDCIVAPACANCSPEVCTDGLDNNCNDLIDCADPACAFDPSCAPEPELCNNGLDDDNDTLVDCADPDCANAPICVQQQSNCQTALLIPGTGSYFGDTTGNTNEESGSCGGDAGEAVFRLVLNEASRVELDSIGTSFDSVLHVRSGSCEFGVEVGCDDDSGGSLWSARLVFDILYPGTYYIFLDGFTIDPFGGANEGPFQLNVDISQPAELCDDGIDNDGDVYVDCADPDCTFVEGCANCDMGQNPTAEFGTGRCTDGRDNDCDGLVDCEDDDCSASFYYVTECCNGMDQNGNGIPDDFNCRCANDSECDPGQICYDHSAFACGFECTAFFGEICPFVAPGSFCNEATGQCEF